MTIFVYTPLITKLWLLVLCYFVFSKRNDAYRKDTRRKDKKRQVQKRKYAKRKDEKDATRDKRKICHAKHWKNERRHMKRQTYKCFKWPVFEWHCCVFSCQTSSSLIAVSVFRLKAWRYFVFLHDFISSFRVESVLVGFFFRLALLQKEEMAQTGSQTE